ncbi:MAG TPA: extracellular solute-binding protein [Solirubrobacteraceae bacterium]|nr:extracellular solute-binding protein [Solirubrobacteraceae bacterium]
MSIPRSLLSVALAFSCVLLLVACGASSSSGPHSITLYSGQHEQTTTLLVHAFERATRIRVHVRSGDEAELGDQIAEEGGASPADVFYTENTPILEYLRERGLLAQVDASTLASVPRRYSSAEGDWVGVSARVSALVYNTSRLQPGELPGSILELAQPRWKGRVAFAPAETDFQPLVTSIAKLEGTATAERWLKGLAANATTYPDNETAVTQVNDGQSEVAPINHYYWYRLRAELGAAGTHSALHYFDHGDAGELVNVSGAAVLASSPAKPAAQRFLAFLVSAEGQRLLAHSHSYEYPLRPGAPLPAGLRSLSSISPAALTPAQLGDGRAALALEQKLGLL